MKESMKKIMMLLVSILLAGTLQAQTAIYAPTSSDGWSLSWGGGISHPLLYSFARQLVSPVGEVALHKQLTASLGVGLEGVYCQGDRAAYRTYDDRMAFNVVGTLNLSRWLGGYHGRPRWVELVGKVGAGWGHTFDKGSTQADYITAKLGAEFNVFLSRNRAWSLGLRPALIYNLRSGKAFEQIVVSKSQADIHCALSLTYYFRNSRGGHHLAAVAPLSPGHRVRRDELIERLRTETEQMREDLLSKEQIILEQQQRIAQLQDSLPAQNAVEKEETLPPPTIQKNDSLTVWPQMSDRIGRRQILEERIVFSGSSAMVDEAQFPIVERLAKCLKSNPEATLVVQGFVGTGNNAVRNARVSRARAEVIRTLLIAQYGIRHERIRAVGAGAGRGEMSLCTVVKE